jgi:competence protein ComEC
MSERDRDHDRRRPRAGARLWPTGARAGEAPGWPLELDDRLRSLGLRLREWLAFDFAPGRLVPWIPIAFGAGVAMYFAADTEPALWAGALASLVALSICIGARARPLAWPLMIGAAALAMGFTFATWKTFRVAHPVLAAPAYGVTLTGFVENREERERSDRITIRVHSMSGPRLTTKLERVRVSVRKGTAPAIGSFIEAKARLSPPLAPSRPGGYDFARDYYFQRLGATGFVLGSVKQATSPHAPDLSLRFAATIAGIRDAIDARIRSVLPGDKGAIASALITGKRDAITAQVNEAMYVSSLAHVLSISGYHMAVVAGVVFFVVRAGLALIPGVASRYPIKKWGALAALVVAAFYLLLSGAEVATQRSFIMSAIVLIGVMFDRPALTLRTISVAALVLLALSPESLVHPSFQMSFAATLALVAAYERGLPWLSAEPTTPVGARIALWGGREIVALLVASLVAGAATTLFAAYHFHRLAPYGVLANLLAMPVVSIWMMPAGLIGLIAIPFGLDRPVWWLMGEGIEWMIAVAVWVAALPGAVGRIAAFGLAPLLFGTAGMVLICLLRSPLRWSGAALVTLGAVLAWQTQRPDVLLSSDAGMVAVRDAGGALRVLSSRRDDFVLKEWLAADGDARAPKDQTLTEGTRCDSNGCIARLRDGKAVALSLTAEGVAEDCEVAALTVTQRPPPPQCAATAIDRSKLRTSGAMTGIWDGKALVLEAARPPTSQRPWIVRPEAPPSTTTRPRQPVAPRDATPRIQDLDPEELGSVAPE